MVGLMGKRSDQFYNDLSRHEVRSGGDRGSFVPEMSDSTVSSVGAEHIAGPRSRASSAMSLRAP